MSSDQTWCARSSGAGAGTSEGTVSRSEWIEGTLPRGVLTLTAMLTEGVDGTGEGGMGIINGPG